MNWRHILIATTMAASMAIAVSATGASAIDNGSATGNGGSAGAECGGLYAIFSNFGDGLNTITITATGGGTTKSFTGAIGGVAATWEEMGVALGGLINYSFSWPTGTYPIEGTFQFDSSDCDPPPVTTVSPPVTTVAPPVTTVSPPVTTVAPPVTTVSPPVTMPPTVALPETGNDNGWMTAMAVIMLSAGIGLVLATRRRAS